MALVFNVNQTAATNRIGYYIFSLKTALKAAGWLVKGSGEGVINGITGSYDNVDTQGNTTATDYISNAADASVTGSWFRLRTPTTLSNGTYRELTFQVLRYNTMDLGTSNVATDYGAGDGGTVRIKYSLCISGSGFVSGTISANGGRTPSSAVAEDEYIIAGSRIGSDTGSYDANGTELAGGKILTPNFDSTNYYWSTIVNNSSPYNFCIFTYSKASFIYAGSNLFAFCDMLTGSYDNSDPDPSVFITYGYWDPSFVVGGRYYGFEPYRAILGYGTANQKMVRLTKQDALNAGQGHIAAEDNMIPSRFYRLDSATDPRGWKGLSTFFLDLVTYDSRAQLDTFSINTTRDKILLKNFSPSVPNANVVLPWNGTIPST